MAVINQGRINNVVHALTEWHRTAIGQEPSRNDRFLLYAYARTALAADDRYLISDTAPKADPDALRLRLAKARLRVEELKVQVREAQLAQEAANRREAAAKEAIATAKRTAERAQAWERSANIYAQQANILRQQLTDNGIEPDRRAS